MTQSPTHLGSGVPHGSGGDGVGDVVAELPAGLEVHLQYSEKDVDRYVSMACKLADTQRALSNKVFQQTSRRSQKTLHTQQDNAPQHTTTHTTKRTSHTTPRTTPHHTLQITNHKSQFTAQRTCPSMRKRPRFSCWAVKRRSARRRWPDSGRNSGTSTSTFTLR